MCITAANRLKSTWEKRTVFAKWEQQRIRHGWPMRRQMIMGRERAQQVNIGRYWLPLVGLAILVIGRIMLQLALYQSGFEALTADDFGRVVVAANWAQQPYMLWKGPWLPFHMYLIGTLLRLDWEVLLVPRAVVFVFGSLSMLAMYGLTQALTGSRRAAFISALLLAVNPAHIWLSSIPLSEIMHVTLLLTFFWAGVVLIEAERGDAFRFVTAALLGIGNTIRFEAWLVSTVFSLYLLGSAALPIRRGRLDRAQIMSTMIALFLIWAFPLAWIIGNYLETGDPLYFLTINRAYDRTWYGPDRSYGAYFATMFRLDPYATVFAVPAIAIGLWRAKQSPSLRWFIGLTVTPFLLYVLLQRGQIQPPGNYIRYLAPFLFLVYPLIAWLGDWLARRLPPSVPASVIVALALTALGATQLQRAFQFVNDPAAEGLRVGHYIRTLREAQPEELTRPVLIELSHYQYLAMHVGANDLEGLIYDRPLDLERLNGTPSTLSGNADLLRRCIASYQPSYIVVRSADLRELVQATLQTQPLVEINGYLIFPVAHTSSQPASTEGNCPLLLGTGVGTRP